MLVHAPNPPEKTMTSLEKVHPLANKQMSQVIHPEAVTQAVIMAGGKGTRLHPYSALLPKPLMPLGDMPILELLLRQMQRAGITEVLVAVNHLRHLIEAFFGDGRQFGLNIRYISEDKPLGTAGALGNMLEELDETFMVTNGDLLTSMDLAAMARRHRETGADASIGVFQRENKIDFGLIEFDANNRLSAYREKPKTLYYVSMGVYILQREAVRPIIKPNEYLDMPSLLLALRAADHDVRCFHDDGLWLDIGRPDDFAQAQVIFEQHRDWFLK
jgi:NDP-sugar pyrophosphorylase family protein